MTGLRDEFGTTYVNPDGSQTRSEHAGQQRFRDVSGAWREVDLTLVAGPDGRVVTRGHPLGLSLAGGGVRDAALVQVTAGVDSAGKARSVAWGWSGTLPRPVLDGSTATYPGVAPGVDLRVVATRSGFEQFFVVTSPAGVVSAVAGWAIPVTTTGGLVVRPDADGGSSLVDPAGVVVSRVPPAMGWDAHVDQTRGGRDSVAAVPVQVEQAGPGRAVLRVAPDAGWVRAAGRQFPITIDPSYAGGTIGPSFDTFVQSSIANTDLSGQPELKAGTYDGSTKARSFVKFPTGPVSGLLVQSASLSLHETWSYSCTPKPVDAWSVTADASTATRWGNQPGLVSKVGSVTAAKGYGSGCPAGRISIPVTPVVQAWSGATRVYGSPTGLSYLNPGATLGSGQSLASANGRYYVWMQPDGNLVTYGPSGYLWNTGTAGNPGAYAVMQSDGNLVVWSASGSVLWNAGTYANPGASLSMQDDGNLVVFAGSPKWSTGPGPAVPPGTIAVVAGSETDVAGWKRFASMETTDDPVLEYTYDRAPAAPAAPSLPNGGTSGGIGYAPSTTPTFSVGVSDPDANLVKASVEVWVPGGARVATCTTPLVASGATAQCTVAPGLSDNTEYTMIARTTDELGMVSPWSPWSPWTPVRVAATPPPAPVITCTGHGDGSWDSDPPAGPVSCTVPGPSGTTYSATGSLQVIVDGGAPTWWGTGQTATVQVPNTAGAHHVTAKVTSLSQLTTTGTVSFGYGPAGLSAPAAGTTATGATRVVAAGPAPASGASVTATVQYRASGDEAGAWTPDPAATNVGVTVSGGMARLDRVVNLSTYTIAGSSARVPVRLDLQVCFTYTSGTSTTRCTWAAGTPATLTRVPKAFGDAYPTAGAGPGQVAGWTGEFWTETTDVSIPAYTGSLSLGRSHATYDGPDDLANWPTQPASGVLGPGWTLKLDGPDAGSAGMDVFDQSLVDGTMTFMDGDGSALVFTTVTGDRRTGTTLTGGVWPAADEDTDLSGATLFVGDLVAVDGAGHTQPGTDGLVDVALTEPDGTVTTWAGKTNPTATAAAVFTPGLVTEPGQAGATTYTRDSQGRVTQILAPTGPDVTCAGAAPTQAGCRYLTLTYDTGTGRLATVTSHLWDPARAGGAGMVSTPVATYAYDGSGRLTGVTDPRVNLATTYTYDGATPRLASITPPGQAAWRLGYTTGPVNGFTSTHLSTVSRDPATGTGAPVRVSSYVYGIDATQTTTGLPDLTKATVDEAGGGWSQTSAPTYGFAVFDADRPATSTGDTPTTITSDHWSYASVQYADGTGRTVNTAVYGAGAWQVTATDYDAKNNVVRSIDASDFAAWRAANTTTGTTTSINRFASTTTYNTDITAETDTTVTNPDSTTRTVTAGTVIVPAGTQATDEWGPSRLVPDPANPATGTLVWARPHTTTTYDEGAPNNGIDPKTGLGYSLPTTTVVTAAPETGAETAVTVTRTGYDAHDGQPGTGDTSGWVWGTPTRVTTVKTPTTTGPGYGAGAGDEVRDTTLDPAGRVIAIRQPSESGGSTSPAAGAGTWVTRFYTAGPNPADTACGGRPEWNGATCTTGPATAAGAQTLTRVQTYNQWLSPTATAETAATAGVTRTTATTYDGGNRPVTTTVTLTGVTGSPAVPATTTTYSPTTGLPTTVSSTAGTVTTGYDGWGRTTTYTPSGAGATTTTYDSVGRVATVTDPHGSTTYGYGPDANGKTERRGLPTTLTHTTAGQVLTFTGAYDPAGNLTTQKLPGGLTQTTTYDTAGEPVGLSYTGPGGVPWLAWTQDNDTTGRVVTDLTPDLAAAPTLGGVAGGRYAHTYTYNGLGHLTTVLDTTTDPANPAGAGLGCTRRTYTFNGNGARTGLATTTDGPGSTCTGSGGTTITRTWTLDAADKITNTARFGSPPGVGAYTYDALGRVTTLPVLDTPTGGTDTTVSYRADDSVDTITAGGTTQTYTYDTLGRRLTATSTSGGATTKTLTRGYADTSDNPAYTIETRPVTGGTRTTTTRYLAALAGGLGATTDTITDPSTGTATTSALTLTNPHGDTITTVPLPTTGDAAGISGWTTTDEYGNTPTGPAFTPAAYTWHGGAERSTDTPAALALMGARLYNPTTGSFTTTDPEYGGNNTTYTYPTDPLNSSDLDGRAKRKPSKKQAVLKWSGKAAVWLTDSKWGKRIETACQFAWGPAGTICGGAYALAYARQRRWKEAGASVAGMVGGGAASYATRQIMKRGIPAGSRFWKAGSGRKGNILPPAELMRARKRYGRLSYVAKSSNDVAFTYSTSSAVKHPSRR